MCFIKLICRCTSNLPAAGLNRGRAAASSPGGPGLRVHAAGSPRCAAPVGSTGWWRTALSDPWSCCGPGPAPSGHGDHPSPPLWKSHFLTAQSKLVNLEIKYLAHILRWKFSEVDM